MKKQFSYEVLTHRLLNDMKKHHLGVDKISYLLSGAPGVGKTSFVTTFAKLLGLPLVLIEVPHISEEHLINIPFLTIGSSTSSQNNEVFTSDFKLVRAESVLATTLKKLSKFSNEEHISILKNDKLLLDLYTKNKDLVDYVREHFNGLMFFDEFYRARGIRITNILRTFLNGMIGIDPIPSGIYTIYASNVNNMVDQGLNVIPHNHQFKIIEFIAPNKIEWFKYISSKHQLSEVVLNTFQQHLTQDDFGFFDVDTEVRLSPRRMEEIIVYIDTLFKRQDSREMVIKYFENNLSNYQTKQHSKVLQKFITIANQLFPIVKNDMEPNWIEVLKNQIEVKNQLGGKRKYVPCLAGKPGIAKTSMVKVLGEELNMNVIHIDCSTLNPDDTIGLPSLRTFNDKEEVFFTEPLLHSIIMSQYTQKNNGKNYTHILFLDEINRTNTMVFNAVRKLILDKELNESYKLPKDVMVIGALNPHGEGTIELTPHLKDVLDIIDANPIFENILNYVSTFDFVKDFEKSTKIDVKNHLRVLWEKFSLKFHSTEDEDGESVQDLGSRYFYLLTDTNSTVYLSPREITTIFLNYIYGLTEIVKNTKYDRLKKYSVEEYSDFKTLVMEVLFQAMDENLYFVLLKHQIGLQEIENTLTVYKNHFISNENQLFEIFQSVSSDVNVSFVSVMERLAWDLKDLDTNEVLFILDNIVANVDNVEEIVQDINEVLSYVVDQKFFTNYIELYDYYLNLFKIMKKVNFAREDFQLKDRLSILFLNHYKEIVAKIKKEPNMYEIIKIISESGVLEQEKFKDLYNEEYEIKFTMG